MMTQTFHFPPSHKGASKKAPVQSEQAKGLAIDDFSAIHRSQGYHPDQALIEGECLLRTRAEKLKLHWMIVLGSELYCYKDPERQ